MDIETPKVGKITLSRNANDVHEYMMDVHCTLYIVQWQCSVQVYFVDPTPRGLRLSTFTYNLGTSNYEKLHNPIKTEEIFAVQ